MIFNFPFEDVGFDEEEWETIPRGDRCIIRDFHLNGGDTDQTAMFGYYETDRQIRKAVNMYHLRARPLLRLNVAPNNRLCFGAVN